MRREPTYTVIYHVKHKIEVNSTPTLLKSLAKLDKIRSV